MADAQNQDIRWIARVTPVPGGTDIERLLQMPLGLDVWERKRDPDLLVVAASEGQISELERRRLATVERLCTAEEFVSESAVHTETDATRGNTKESEEEEPRG